MLNGRAIGSVALAATVLVKLGAVVEAAKKVADACVARYSDNYNLWNALSHFPTEYAPRGHRPDWYWEFILQGQRSGRPQADRVAQLQLEDVGYGDDWLQVCAG